MGFSRQEYWSGLPFPTSGVLPDPGIEPLSLKSFALAGIFFTTSATWEAQISPHSKTLAWKIPWAEEPGRLQSMGSLESDTTERLNDFTFTFHLHALEKEMATHSSDLAWRIPGMVEPVGLPSMGSHRVGHD